VGRLTRKVARVEQIPHIHGHEATPGVSSHMKPPTRLARILAVAVIAAFSATRTGRAQDQPQQPENQLDSLRQSLQPEAPTPPALGTTRPKSAPVGGDQLGFAVAGAGDVDGDGAADLVVGAFANDSGGGNAGAVFVYSGASGDIIYEFIGDNVRENLGYAVASGDINGDGTPDILAGAPSYSLAEDTAVGVGRVYTWIGATGAKGRGYIGTHANGRFGYNVAVTGDVDQDGMADFAVAESGYHDSSRADRGAVYIYSGQSGDLIRSLVGQEPGDRFGHALANLGDLDGDGYPELAVGAHRYSALRISSGRVYIFSGRTGDTLLILDGASLFEQFGFAVAAAGDVDGDGVSDVAVGAPFNDARGSRSGCVRIFSGANGSLIRQHFGVSSREQLGIAMALVSDLNRDGTPELLVGARGHSNGGRDAGAAYVLSGADDSILYSFMGEAAGDNFGAAVAAAGDVDRDGTEDLLIGAFGSDSGGRDAGRAYVYSGATGTKLHVFTGTSQVKITAPSEEKPVAAAPTQPAADSTAKPEIPDVVYDSTEVDGVALLRRNIPAIYPRSEIPTGKIGWIHVRVLVLADGSPSLIEIAGEDSLGVPFQEAAIAAARQWLFAPATKDGKDVPSWVVLPIGFEPPEPGSLDTLADTSRAVPETSQQVADTAQAPVDTARPADTSAQPAALATSGTEPVDTSTPATDTLPAPQQTPPVDTATLAGDTAMAADDTARADTTATDSALEGLTPPDTVPVAVDTASTPPPPAESGPLDTSKTFDFSELDVQPRLVGRINATYPPKALENRDTATVRFRVQVLADGSVGDVEITSITNPGKGFEEATIEAVKRWRFEPGQKDNQPVKVWVNFPLIFRLPD